MVNARLLFELLLGRSPPPAVFFPGCPGHSTSAGKRMASVSHRVAFVQALPHSHNGNGSITSSSPVLRDCRCQRNGGGAFHLAVEAEGHGILSSIRSDVPSLPYGRRDVGIILRWRYWKGPSWSIAAAFGSCPRPYLCCSGIREGAKC